MQRAAAALLALLTVAGPALAAPRIDKPQVVSAKVGPILQQAQMLIVAKNYKAALVKLNQAEAVKSSPDDAYVINQMRQAIAASSLDAKERQCTSATMGVTRCDGRQVQP